MTREDDSEKMDQLHRLKGHRRAFLKASITSALGGASLPILSEKVTAVSSSEEVLFETDFETYDGGTYPDGWTPSGNRNQEVVNTTAGSGLNSFKISGRPGGCWEAISHHPVSIPGSGTVWIEGKINPTSQGAIGCHKEGRGTFLLRTEVSESWYPGNAVRLFTFGHDGTFLGTHDTDLGSYEPDTWYGFTIEYVRTDGSV